MKYISLIALIVNLLFTPTTAFSAMSSTNFRIEADSVGVGGALGTSTSFRLDDSIGEISGTATSTSFEVRGGFLSSGGGSLSMSITNSSISLGTLSASQVTTGSTVITVSTDSDTGYTLSVASVSGTGLTSVSDGSVSAGSEEYGLAASGLDNLVSGDVAVSAGRTLSSSSTPVTETGLTVTFKASISSASVQASYSQTVNTAAVANF